MLKPGDIRRFKKDKVNVVGVVRYVKDNSQGFVYHVTTLGAQNYSFEAASVEVTSTRLEPTMRDALINITELDKERTDLMVKQNKIQNAISDNSRKSDAAMTALKNLTGVLGEQQFDALIRQNINPLKAQKMNNLGFRVNMRSTSAAEKFSYHLTFSEEIREYRYRTGELPFVETEYDGNTFNCANPSQYDAYKKLVQRYSQQYPFSATSSETTKGKLVVKKTVAAEDRSLFFSIELQCTIRNGQYDEKTALAIAELLNKAIA